MATTTAPPGTYRTFFDQLLTALGITPTPGAEAGLADVVHEEGANNYNNPFNIEYHPGQNTAWQGVASFNSVGVQKYATPAAGIAATTAFLKDNPRYGNLLNSLKTGNTATIQQALTAEYTWAPFHTASSAQEQAILNQPVAVATGLPTGGGATGGTSSAATGSTASGVANAQPSSFLGIPSVGDIKNAMIEGIFLLTGLGIVTLGVFRMAAPAVKKAANTAATIAPLAAA